MSSIPSGERLREALTTAFDLHRRQVRKGGGVPYVSHLMAVASLVIEDGGDEDEAAAALLHDAVEDQGGDAVRVMIRERFGERVAGIVEAVTESDVTPKPPWAERKAVYLRKLLSAPPEALRLAAADKLHNARCVYRGLLTEGLVVWERFTTRSGPDQIAFYRGSLDILGKSFSGPMLGELSELIDRIEALDAKLR